MPNALVGDIVSWNIETAHSTVSTCLTFAVLDVHSASPTFKGKDDARTGDSHAQCASAAVRFEAHHVERKGDKAIREKKPDMRREHARVRRGVSFYFPMPEGIQFTGQMGVERTLHKG